MKSSKCPNCALVQWAVDSTCKRCAAPLDASVSSQSQFQPAANHSGYQAYQQPSPVYSHTPELKSGLAIASMVVAIIAFPTTFLLIGLLLAPIAVIMGIVALRRASKKPTVYGGKGFAIAGISVGSVVCVFFVPLIAAIAIPNLLASRRAANEGSALNTLETIALAQDTHASTNGSGACGDLMTLAVNNLLDAQIASGKKNGYRFTAGGNQFEGNGCEVRATPESSSHGTRSFYFSSSDNIVRATMNGGPANHTDPPATSRLASSR